MDLENEIGLFFGRALSAPMREKETESSWFLNVLEKKQEQFRRRMTNAIPKPSGTLPKVRAVS